ncbi:MAG TPA: hypothetical protein VF136_11015 [Methylomirabilota bacterium]
MRSRPALSVLLIPVVVSVLAGCGGGSRPRPAGTGSVPTGGSDVDQVRRQLQGTWELVTYQTFAPDGSRNDQPVSGRLSYDGSGTLRVHAEYRRQGRAPFVLDYGGRAVIDPRAQRLRVEAASVPRPPGGEETVVAAVSLDRPRHYQLQGNLLTVSALDAGSGRPVATAVWRKVS